MKILIVHEFVMGWMMMFGKIIGTVGFPRGPVEVKLLLSNAIFEPVVTHVKRLGAFHADCGMEDAVRGGVVGFDRRAGWGLLVAHFFKGGANGNSLLRIEEQASDFGFGG